MSFNFPDSPTAGQVFEPIAGVFYEWVPPVWKRYVPTAEDFVTEAPIDGEQYARTDGEWAVVEADVDEAPIDGLTYGRKDANWATMVGGAVISDTPPPEPLQAGQFWYEADTGNTFVWFDDGNSKQWVQINIQQPVPPPMAGVTAETRNRIVNGAMQVSQEWGNTLHGPTATMNIHSADQWYISSATTPGTASVLRVQSTTPNGSKDRIRVTVGTAKAVLAGGDAVNIQQSIEGIRVADFRYGTVQAKQAILRFGWKSPAGTYSIVLYNSAINRSYVALFTVSAGQANIDTEQTIVIPGDTIGTWLTDTGIGLAFRVTIATGTTYQGVAGWQSGFFIGTAANTNGMATAGAVFELFDVGFYLDPDRTGVPPRWQMPDEAEETRACQRYYERSDFVIHSTLGYENGFWAARKRIVPAMSVSIGSGSGGTIATNGFNGWYQNVANSATWGSVAIGNARM